MYTPRSAASTKNVTTVEDPVEYVFPTINQIQISEAAAITFASGMKSILRQDPDMILVGEMRDAETSRMMPPPSWAQWPITAAAPPLRCEGSASYRCRAHRCPTRPITTTHASASTTRGPSGVVPAKSARIVSISGE
jgi:Type II/IV secretion system protein